MGIIFHYVAGKAEKRLESFKKKSPNILVIVAAETSTEVITHRREK